MKKLFAVGLLWLYVLPAWADVPLMDFCRRDSFHDAQISPDGAYVAVRFPMDRQSGIGVLEVATGKVVAKVGLKGDRGFGDFEWANGRRLVAEVTRDYAMWQAPVRTGEIVGLDFDGRNLTYLIGYHGEGGDPDGTKPHETFDLGFSEILRRLPEDPDHVLIANHPWFSKPETETVYRMDIHTGALDQKLKAPIPGGVRFAADRDGFVRFATGETDDGSQKDFIRTPELPEWRPFSIQTQGDDHLYIEGIDRANAYVYLHAYAGNDHRGLVRVDLKTGEQATVSQDDVADLTSVVWSFDEQEPIAVRYDAGKTEIRFLESQNPASRALQDIEKAFPGQVALPVSTTDDGSRAVIEVFSDRNPGDFYLFDTKTRQAKYFVGEADWIDPDAMSERRPVHFPARDGTEIHGYLTIPKGIAPNQMPLVVNAHGGPFFVRDHWGWDPDAEALASRGYAVLQVNFRGSSGYGKKFENEGKQNWDRTMIDDITDGAHWAVSNGLADPGRMCIYGASYGGYAAVMSAVREPDLYRCVVDVSGVVDLIRDRDESDTSESLIGRNYFRDYVGSTDARLQEASPIHYLSRLKAEILIVHGSEDRRVPYTQAKELRAELDRLLYPYEFLPVYGEAHGFYSPDNEVVFYKTLIDFLDRKIGPKAPPAAPPPKPKPGAPSTPVVPVAP